MATSTVLPVPLQKDTRLNSTTTMVMICRMIVASKHTGGSLGSDLGAWRANHAVEKGVQVIGKGNARECTAPPIEPDDGNSAHH